MQRDTECITMQQNNHQCLNISQDSNSKKDVNHISVMGVRKHQTPANARHHPNANITYN